MAMSKKDYNAIAWELASVRPATRDAFELIGWEAAVYAVATACAESNPAFDRTRFLHACMQWDGAIRDGRRVYGMTVR